MPDVQRLLDQLGTSGAVDRVRNNPAAQFGLPNRPLLGAELLPQRLVEENSYTDDTVIYRTVVANAGTRYSPVVLKGNAYVGSVKVELFEMDLGSELTAREYDVLIRILDRNLTMDAAAQVTDWLNVTVNMGLEELREVYRWKAIVNATMVRRGANGYNETINYSNPAGHRVTVANAWSDDANDPFDDIIAMAQMLADKGYEVNRIISTRHVTSIMGANENVRTRVGGVRVSIGNGQVISTGGRASLRAINREMDANGLPPIEIYDQVYHTQTGTGRFIPQDCMILICTTGKSDSVQVGEDTIELLPNVLGYYGVGRAAGQARPGRVLKMKHLPDEKPPHIEAQGWETSAPVITAPEAIAVLSGIA